MKTEDTSRFLKLLFNSLLGHYHSFKPANFIVKPNKTRFQILNVNLQFQIQIKRKSNESFVVCNQLSKQTKF